MKLHLPKGLRTALLACLAAFAGVGTTISTATITGGVFAVTMAGQAMAATTISSSTDGVTDGAVAYSSDWGTDLIVTDGIKVTDMADTSYTLTLSGGAVKFTNKSFGGGTVTLANDSTGAVTDNSIIMANSSFRAAVTGTGNLSLVNPKDGGADAYYVWSSINHTGTLTIGDGSAAGTVSLKSGGSIGSNVTSITIAENAVFSAESGSTISSTVAITNNGTMTLTATTIGNAITNNGTLTLDCSTLQLGSAIVMGENATLSITNAASTIIDVSKMTATTVDGKQVYTLLTGEGSLDLTALGLDAGNIIGLDTYGSWTLNDDGTMTFAAIDSLTFGDGELTWANNAAFGDSGVFEAGKTVDFQGAASVTLGSDVAPATMVVDAAADVTVLASAEGYVLSADKLENKGSTALNVASTLGTVENDGTLVLGAAATVTTMENSGSLVVDADSTVATYSTASSGTIQVADGKALTIGTEGYNSDQNLNLLSLLQAAQSGEGYTGSVILDGTLACGNPGSSQTVDVQGNYILREGMSINGWSAHNINVLEGGSLTAQNAEGARQNISILTKQTLTVSGGTVTASGIILGHGAEDGNPGYLVIEDGVVNVDYISMQNKGTNLLKMTGGTLNILSNPWTSGGSLRVADEQSEVQLLGGVVNTTGNTEGAYMQVNENTKITLGEVEFAGDKDITLANGQMYFTGTVTNNVSTKLQLHGSAYYVDDISVLETTDLDAPAAGTNGFGSTSQYWLVKKGDNGGTFSAGEITTVTNGDNTLTLTVADGGAYILGSSSTYYVNVGEVAYGSDETAGATSYALGGGTLTVATGVSVAEPVKVIADSTISGEATSGTNHAGIAGGIKASGNGGDLTINSAATTASTNGAHGDFFAISGDVNLGTNNLIIGSGVVRLGNPNQDSCSDDYSFTAGSIVVNSGATLEIFRDGGTLDTDVELAGGTLRIQQINGNGSENLAIGTINVTAASTIDRNSWGYDLEVAALTGTGDLTLSNSGWTTVEKVENYTGNVTVAGGALEVVSALDLSEGGVTVNGGTLYAEEGVTISGGKATLTSGDVLTPTLAVTDGELVLGSGITLAGSRSWSWDTWTYSYGNLEKALLTGGQVTAAGDYTLEADVISLGGATIASSTYETTDEDSGETTTSGYALTIGSADSTISFEGTLINAGNLTLAGAIEVDDLSKLECAGSTLADGVSGYGSAIYTLVKAATPGEDVALVPTLTAADKATVEGVETALTVANGGASIVWAETTYHVRVDAVDGLAYSTITGVEANDGVDFTTISMEGGALTVASGEAVTERVEVTTATTISGEATSGTNHAGIAGGITVSGEGGDLTINSAAATPSTNDAHGDFFAISGDVDLGTNNLIIDSGVVRLGNPNQDVSSDAYSFTAGSIVVNSGATLEIRRDGGTLDTDVELAGGTLRIQQIQYGGSGNLVVGDINVTADSTIDRNDWGYALEAAALTGSANLEFTNSGTTIIGMVSAYTGTAKISGGTLKLVDSTLSSGTVNVSGGTLSADGALAIHDGAVVTLDSGSVNVSKIELTGGSLTYAGGSVVLNDSSDKLAFTGGTFTAAGDFTIGGNMTLGAVTLQSGTYTADEEAKTANITLGAGGTITFAATVDNDGSLVIGAGASLVVTDSTALRSDAVGEGRTSGNGFAQSKFWLVDGSTVAEGSTASLTLASTDVKVAVAGETYDVTADAGSLTFLKDADSGLYYVNEDSVAYGGEDSSMVIDNVTGLVLGGGDLVMGAGLAEATTEGIAMNASATITLAEGVSLSSSDITFAEGTELTLAGSGTYVAGTLDDIAKLASLKDSTAWTGVIDTLASGDGTLVAAGQDLNDLGNANSTVLLEGVTGYFADGEVNTNIQLTNTSWAGLEISNATADLAYTFNGTVSGSGNLNVASSNAGKVDLSFAGEVSGWTGILNVNNAGGSTVAFSAADQTVNVTVNGSASVVYSGTGTTTVAKGGSYTGATTIAAGSTVQLNQGVNGFGSSTVLESGSTLKLQGNTLANDITSAGTLQVSADSSITSLAGGTLQVADGATLTVAGALSGAGLELAGALSVGGAVSDITSISVLGTVADLCAASPLVSAQSFVAGDTLTVSVDSTYLSETVAGSYTLVAVTGDDAVIDANTKLALNIENAQDGVVGQMTYTLAVSEDGKNIVLTGAFDGMVWDDAAGSVLSATAGETDGLPTDPIAESRISFTGSDDITVEGAVEVTALRVETDGGAYTFTGTEGASITAASFVVDTGDLALESLAVDTESLTVGQGGGKSDASLVVAEDSVLTAGTMTVNVVTDTEDIGFTNEGETVVEGSLIFKDMEKAFTNAGELSFGDGSVLGKVDNTGTLTAAAGTSSIAELVTGGTVAVKDGATLSVDAVSDAAIAAVALEGAATINIGGTADEAALWVDSLSGSADSKFISSRAVVLGSATQQGGYVETSSLDITNASGSTMTELVADSLTLNVNGLKGLGGSALLTLTSAPATGQSISLTLTGIGATRTVGMIDTETFTYNNTELGVYGSELATLSDGSTYTREWTTYTLVDAVAGYDWLLDADQQEALQTHFALAGTYAKVDFVDGDVLLVVYKDDPREWLGGDYTDAASGDNWAGHVTNANGMVLDLSKLDAYAALDTVDIVNVTKDTTIDLTALDKGDNEDGLLINHLTGDSGLTLKGDKDDLATLANLTDDSNGLGSSEFGGTLTIDGMQVDVVADNGNTLSVAETVLTGADAVLNVTDSATYLTGALNGTEGTLAGTITVTGKGGNYSGSYNAATVNLAAGAQQTLAPKSGLTVTGVDAGVTLDYTSGNAAMDAIMVDSSKVTLANMNGSKMNTLTLAAASSATNSEVAFSLKAADVAAGVNGQGVAPVITKGATLDVSGSTLMVTQVDTEVQRTAFDVSQGTEDITLFTLADGGAADGTQVSFGENDAFFSRYFKNVEVKDGKVVADLVTDYYSSALATSQNGTVGLQMMDAAFLELNPQGMNDKVGANSQYADLANVLNSLDSYMATGDATSADKLGAAVAGSGVASLGMALAGDMERQLKAIRNRTTTMGVDPSVVNEEMPYFNAWINAEGDYRSMDDDGMLAGYDLNSWGGTVGFDVDVNPNFTCGLALTAMYGDFTAEAADKVEGDMETYYVSAFARATSGAWVHTFVASIGTSTTELERTVSHKYGSYTTEGEADGMSFGLLYEVARTFALNEDATACWQPVFNVAYRHTEVDAFTESGSDAALSLGDQSLDTVTFGLGARVQAVVGENLYNRTSVFEARALVKVDAGDRQSEMDTALLNASTASGRVESAEMDAFGVELGVGLTVPMGMDSGSLFMDASVDFRGSYTNFNGSVGYRINF